MGEIGQRDGQRIIRPDLGIAVGADDEQRDARAEAGQRGEEIEGVEAGPLKVVEQEKGTACPGSSEGTVSPSSGMTRTSQAQPASAARRAAGESSSMWRASASRRGV